MKIPCGLIGQNDARISSYSSCDAYQLLLSTGQLVRKKIFLPDDLKAVEYVAHNGRTLGPGHISIRERHVNILLHRQVVEQVILLKHEADVSSAQLCAPFTIELVHGLIKKEKITYPTIIKHAENAE
jgi:hypothetical protein